MSREDTPAEKVAHARTLAVVSTANTLLFAVMLTLFLLVPADDQSQPTKGSITWFILIGLFSAAVIGGAITSVSRLIRAHRLRKELGGSQ